MPEEKEKMSEQERAVLAAKQAAPGSLESTQTQIPEGQSVPGNLSADAENEKRERGEESLDANPGSRPGGGKTPEEHIAREKAAEDKSKQ
jgi:hypothetical protein